MHGLENTTPMFEKAPFLNLPDSHSDFALKLIAHFKLGGNS